MNLQNLSTKAKITWCPGCPNSQILVAFRQAIKEMDVKVENLVAFSGIGCHGKITDYLNINTFTSLHGRLIPAMTGAKCANSELIPVGFSGDGDSYNEGIGHIIHAAKRNSDINIFIHSNQVFALTTGQFNAVSPKGFDSKSSPSGSIEEPFNPLLLMLASGATFVARTYAVDINGTKEIIKKAIAHKGFSYVDIIQPCLTFFDTRDFFRDRIYWMDESLSKDDLKAAIDRVQEKDKVPLGIFYQIEKPTFVGEL